jgi:deazaflavin-dependent oxidoreductase (nitroreductase family)
MDLDFDRMASRRTIDLTTMGRKTGMPRRIEIWWFRIEDRFIITGTPGRRDWMANVIADPNVVIHLDGDDIPAQAVPVEDAQFRQWVFTRPHTSWYATQAELDHLVATAPMVEIVFEA